MHQDCYIICPNGHFPLFVLCSAVCPDFFVGKEPWSPTKDWSTFQEWLKDKKPTDINKWVHFQFNLSRWTPIVQSLSRVFNIMHESNSYFILREVDVVLKYLKEQCGAKRIGTVGFCWGGVATHYLALLYPEIKAGVSVYGTSFNQENI